MISRIKQLLSGQRAETTPEVRADEVRLATAALLVESAFMDGNFDEDEMQSIQRLLTDRFDLNEEELETLVFEAEQAVAATGQLYQFTRVIKDRFDEEQRIGMIEMLWEVAFADGNVDHFEQNLIQRVAGLIFVSDRDRGDAKKRVMARLGIS